MYSKGEEFASILKVEKFASYAILEFSSRAELHSLYGQKLYQSFMFITNI